MCFSSNPPKQQVNPAPYPVDQAYKAVQATTEPDTSPPDKSPEATVQPIPLRTESTGLTFGGR